MRESAEGLRMAAIRQCAGTAGGVAWPAAAARYGPAGRDSAAVMVTLGSASDASRSHGDWAWAAQARAISRAIHGAILSAALAAVLSAAPGAILSAAPGAILSAAPGAILIAAARGPV